MLRTHRVSVKTAVENGIIKFEYRLLGDENVYIYEVNPAQINEAFPESDFINKMVIAGLISKNQSAYSGITNNEEIVKTLNTMFNFYSKGAIKEKKSEKKFKLPLIVRAWMLAVGADINDAQACAAYSEAYKNKSLKEKLVFNRQPEIVAQMQLLLAENVTTEKVDVTPI